MIPNQEISSPKEKPEIVVPDFGKEVALLIQDFVYSKEDIELSFDEDHIKEANLFSVYLKDECICTVLLDQHKPEFLYLGYMSTLKKYRRKGIGKTLMKIVFRLAYMIPNLESIYLISRNIRDENGKWYSVKTSPVYRFWESLGFVRIPWNKFPNIPSVLETGTILTQARAYQFTLTEGNYERCSLPCEKLFQKLVEQVGSNLLKLKAFSPLMHHKRMEWPPFSGFVVKGEQKIRSRFHRDKVHILNPSPYRFGHQPPQPGMMNPLMMQQEIQFNNMMLQSMYYQQQQMQQIAMFNFRRQMQIQAARQRQAQAQQNTLTTTQAAPQTNQAIPQKRKIEEGKEEPK